MGVLEYVQKFAGLDFDIKTDSMTDIKSGFLSKDAVQDVLSTKLPGLLGFTPPEMSVTSTTITDTQNTVTPASKETTSDADELSRDSYRYGRDSVPSSDNLSNPRVLGERQDDIVDLASISLSLDGGIPGTDKFSVSAYSRFFLQAVTEAEQEKFQVVETFSNYYAFFFGKRPPFYRYSGILLNDQNHSWNNDFKFYYEYFFRATRSTELFGSVSIKYDGRVVSGFIVGLNMQQVAEVDKGIPFSIDVLVVQHDTLRNSADIRTLIDKRRGELNELSTTIRNFIAESNKNAKSTVVDAAKKFAYSTRTGNKKPIAKKGFKDPRNSPSSNVAMKDSTLPLPAQDNRIAGPGF